jgi:hypothetical protein
MMMKKAWVGVVSAMVVVGCAGGSGGIGAGDGGSSGGGGGDGGACTTIDLPGTRACVPRTAKPNTPLSIEVEGEGCLGCGTTLLPCTVTRDGSKIVLAIEANQCPLPEGTPCATICQIPKASCSLPALPSGSYRLEFGSGTRVSTDEPRMLVVADGGQATSCTLPPGPPAPISATDFPRSCTVGDDATCTLVIEGDVCKPCVCPTGAIATSANDDYADELRTRRATCTSGGGSPSCAPCPDDKVARCVAGACTVGAK